MQVLELDENQPVLEKFRRIKDILNRRCRLLQIPIKITYIETSKRGEYVSVYYTYIYHFTNKEGENDYREYTYNKYYSYTKIYLKYIIKDILEYSKYLSVGIEKLI